MMSYMITFLTQVKCHMVLLKQEMVILINGLKNIYKMNMVHKDLLSQWMAILILLWLLQDTAQMKIMVPMMKVLMLKKAEAEVLPRLCKQNGKKKAPRQQIQKRLKKCHQIGLKNTVKKLVAGHQKHKEQVITQQNEKLLKTQ